MASEFDLETRKQTARAWFEALQDRILTSFEALETDCAGPFPDETSAPGRAVRKPWQRKNHDGAPGGGGTMAILKGRVFEKAGVHVSTVFGTFAPEFAAQIPGAAEDPRFWASGISLIVHPWNPNVPAVHRNTRFVVTAKHWFGGGADLTPVLDARRTQEDPDTVDFHAALQGACARHAPVAPYDKFKAWCDDYFVNRHRGEPRGIGGIFYDDFAEGGAEHGLALTRAVGDAFLQAYLPIVQRRLAMPWGERERQHQLYRRGRYVEFNLVWDRGTHFGLQSGGRTESILLSMPPLVRWAYQHQPEPGSPEARLTEHYLVPRAWV